MIQELADRHARWVQALLQGFHLALSGALALDDASRARISIMVQTQSTLSLLTAAAQDALNSARQQAMADAGLRPEQLQETHGLDEEMDERVRSIVLADARTAVRHLQARQLREQLLRGQMKPDAARMAARGELPSQQRDLFVQLDKAQRRFLSDALLTGTVRGLMFRAWGHSFASSLAAAGEGGFVATRDQQRIELDFSGNWADWADAELHPNCRWALTRKDAL